MEKKHKFAVGEKVFTILKDTNIYANIFIGIKVVYSLDRDCDGTPIYTLIDIPKHVQEDYENIFHITDKQIRNFCIFGCTNGISESVLLKIPQKDSYNQDDLIDYYRHCGFSLWN